MPDDAKSLIHDLWAIGILFDKPEKERFAKFRWPNDDFLFLKKLSKRDIRRHVLRADYNTLFRLFLSHNSSLPQGELLIEMVSASSKNAH